MITPNAAKSYVTKLTRRNRNWRVKNLDPDPTKRKEQLRIIENRRKEIKHLREDAHRMATDSGEEKEGCNSEEDSVQEDTSDGGDATCHSTTNPNSTGQKEHEVKVDCENDGNIRED